VASCAPIGCGIILVINEVLVLVEGAIVAPPTVAARQICDRQERVEQVTYSVPAGEFTLAVSVAAPESSWPAWL
jgi:hypothetical protein